MTKPVIVFVGAVYPGQFGHLCEYLRHNGFANSYFLTTKGHAQANRHRGTHILGFKADGPIIGPQSYYYSSKVERSARIGRGVLQALQAFQKTKHIDVVVAHSLWGAPHFLYDELDAAVVSYIEFLSYRTHGWDPSYPPDLSQRLADRNMEMLHLQQAVRSDLVICPSQHAKKMFPKVLQENISVQMEGFDFSNYPANSVPRPPSRRLTIGFAARDLSSAKGFDVFVRLVDQLVAKGVDANFVAIGGAQVSTYSYEPQWVNRTYGGTVASFKDHLLRIYPNAARSIQFTEKLSYGAFAQAVGQIDLFLYPLQYGVANWGLMELLGRGACVLAPNRGYPAEVIDHDINGYLLPDDDATWLEAIQALMADPVRQNRYRDHAQRKMRDQYSLDAVAPKYMALFERAAKCYKASR